MRFPTGTLAAALGLAVPLGAAADPVTLKFAFPGPPNSTNLSGGLAPWAKLVEESSQGALKIQIFPGGTIATAQQTLDRVINSVAEIGYTSQGLYGKQFQGSSVVELPFLVSSAQQASVPLWNLFENGVLADEYKVIKPVALFAFPPAYLQFKKQIGRAHV